MNFSQHKILAQKKNSMFRENRLAHLQQPAEGMEKVLEALPEEERASYLGTRLNRIEDTVGGGDGGQVGDVGRNAGLAVKNLVGGLWDTNKKNAEQLVTDVKTTIKTPFKWAEGGVKEGVNFSWGTVARTGLEVRDKVSKVFSLDGTTIYNFAPQKIMQSISAAISPITGAAKGVRNYTMGMSEAEKQMMNNYTWKYNEQEVNKNIFSRVGNVIMGKEYGVNGNAGYGINGVFSATRDTLERAFVDTPIEVIETASKTVDRGVTATGEAIGIGMQVPGLVPVVGASSFFNTASWGLDNYADGNQQNTTYNIQLANEVERLQQENNQLKAERGGK